MMCDNDGNKDSDNYDSDNKNDEQFYINIISKSSNMCFMKLWWLKIKFSCY